MWISCATKNEDILPGFYELSQDPGSQQFLASLSADVLRAGINENHDTVGKLVSVLLLHDQRAALEIGETELARNELSAEVRAIWSTALFVIDPSKYLDSLENPYVGPDAALWEAIEVIRGDRHEKRGVVSLTLGTTRGSHYIGGTSICQCWTSVRRGELVAKIHGMPQNLSPTRSSY